MEARSMKVLVTAASKHGSTAEIAERIGTVLTAAGLQVSLTAPDEVDAIVEDDAVVLGSAIYMGRWLEPAREFVQRFSGQLRDMPVWAFSSGPVGDPPKPAETPAEVLALLETIDVREHEVFTGDLDRGKLGFSEKVITRAVGAAEGDYRDWVAVETWARRIAATLLDELGWRHDNAAERDEQLREFWQREMSATEPVG
jgi:menaquinone-dependent protoporphyrinogen oxidase